MCVPIKCEIPLRFQKANSKTPFGSSSPSCQPASAVSVGHVQADKIAATFPRLSGNKRVSALQISSNLAICAAFYVPVSAPRISISKLRIERLGSTVRETGSITPPPLSSLRDDFRFLDESLPTGLIAASLCGCELISSADSGESRSTPKLPQEDG